MISTLQSKSVGQSCKSQRITWSLGDQGIGRYHEDMFERWSNSVDHTRWHHQEIMKHIDTGRS